MHVGWKKFILPRVRTLFIAQGHVRLRSAMDRRNQVDEDGILALSKRHVHPFQFTYYVKEAYPATGSPVHLFFSYLCLRIVGQT